jgi:hypothetical protein
LLIAGLTVIAMLVLQLVVIFGAAWFVYPHANLTEVAQKPILLLLSQFLIYAVVAAFMVMLVEGKYHVPFWEAIRWKWPSSEWKLLGLGATMMFTLGLLQSLLPMPKDTPFEHLFDRPRDRGELGPIDGGDILPRFHVPSAGAAHGSGLGNRVNGAAVRLDSFTAIWLGMGRRVGHCSCGCGVWGRTRRDRFGGSEFPGPRGVQRCSDDRRDRLHTWVPAFERRRTLVEMKVPARNQH